MERRHHAVEHRSPPRPAAQREEHAPAGPAGRAWANAPAARMLPHQGGSRLRTQRQTLQRIFGPRGPAGAGAALAVSAPPVAPFVVQRQVQVGAQSMTLFALKRQAMARQGLTRREVDHIFANADGKSWASWSDLAIWMAFGQQLMEMDEDKEGEFTVDTGHSHAWQRHTIAGIWDARRVLTAHPDWVAIFNPGTVAQAEAAMPDRFTAWVRVEGDRWDATFQGVHYQAQWAPGHRVMHLLTCYPLGTGMDVRRSDVEKALEMAQAGGGYDRFETLILGLAAGNAEITRQVREYTTKSDDWFARRMGGSGDKKDSTR
jgi:hypothetical protein